MAGPRRAGSRGGQAVDILCNGHTNRKARPLLEALFNAAAALGFDVMMGDHSDMRAGAWRVVYGLGGSDRTQYVGYPGLIAFDLAYWDRKGENRKFRVSIGSYHCPKRIMRGANPGAARWQQSGLRIRQGGDPAGPVLLVGNGPKSNAVGADGWSARKSEELKTLGRTVWYRPKPGRPAESGVRFDAIADGLIDDVLEKVSLVVCRHSNVAVDACRLGVPVVCDDGAAAAIYPSQLEDWQHQPSEATRYEFLHRLAWWQWAPNEAMQFWQWIKGKM